MSLDYETVVKKAVGKGLSDAEVYAVESTTVQFTVANDRVIESTWRKRLDIGLRGAVGRRVGSIRVNTLEEVDSVLEKLLSITRASQEDPYWGGFPPVYKLVAKPKTYDERTATMSEEEYVEVLKYTMDKFKEPALSKGATKAVVTEGMFEVARAELSIVNSNGVNFREMYTEVSLWLVLSVEKNGSSSSKTLIYAKNLIDEKALAEAATREGELAMLFFNAQPVESGVYDVVLDPSVAGLVLTSSLAPAFSALNILENRSPLRNKHEQLVMSEKVTIIDDPFLEGATGTRSFDDEGVPARAKPVVEKGVFTTILQSYYTSRRMNTEPTGNGVRQSPATQPVPGFTNFVVKPGKGKLDKFAEELEKGLVVYEVIGYWMSDPVTGSVKATVTHGLLIEKGSVVKPVKGVVLGGNVYEWLSRNLVEVGEDVYVVDNTATPSMWIREVKVAGK
ncbi:MAG: TldD/PmbA family protein [Desulfurococcaceae archaeon]